jgi:hypothetical protein
MKTIGLILAKFLLVIATLLALSSFGGMMMFAAPILIPLHWLAAKKTSSGWARGGWIFFGVVSFWEAMWMYSYLGYGNGIALLVSLAAAMLGTMFFVATTEPRFDRADQR